MAFLVSPSLSLHVSFPHRSLSSIPARSPLFFFLKGFPQFRLCVDVVSRDPLTSAVLSAWLSARLPWVNDIFVFVRHLLLFFFAASSTFRTIFSPFTFIFYSKGTEKERRRLPPSTLSTVARCSDSSEMHSFQIKSLTPACPSAPDFLLNFRLYLDASVFPRCCRSDVDRDRKSQLLGIHQI